jgi:hypothetical protein
MEPQLHREMMMSLGETDVGSVKFCAVWYVIETQGAVNKVLEPGHIHFCQLNTKDSNGDYSSDQTHFFALVHDREITLLQVFGGVPGLTVKRVPDDINQIIRRLLNCDHALYEELFEIPEDREDYQFSHLLNFDQTAFRAVSIPLTYPTLAQFNSFLALYGLNFNK